MATLLLAHRGDTINFRENTIAAFQSAFNHGADGIELDIQFYKDKLIVVHNYLFDKSGDYPSLSDVVRACAGKGRLEIEVKSMDLDFLPKLKQIIRAYKNADFELTTSVWPVVHYLRQTFPDIRLGIIFHSNDFETWMTEEFVCTKVTKLMKLMQGNVAHLPWEIIMSYPSVVNACHKSGIKVHSHIFKQELEAETAIYRKMRELTIDQCTFDDIRLPSVLHKK
jgi:glycerophosphoryl diester phosphodiesterase